MKEMNGIFDMSNSAYHSSLGISRSALCEVKNSPLNFWEKFMNSAKNEFKATPAMKIGSAVHALVLEPEIFEKEFKVSPKFNRRKKSEKEAEVQFYQENASKIILEENEYHRAQEIAISIIEHPSMVGFLSGNFSVEKSLFWTDKDTGLLCKARPDIWQHDISVVGEIKTTNDATPHTFPHTIKRYNYHIQAAMQIDAIFETTGNLIENFCFIAAQTDPPFKPYLYILDQDLINLGREEYKSYLKIIKKCMTTDKWDLERETPIIVSNTFSKPLNTLMEIYACQQK